MKLKGFSVWRLTKWTTRRPDRQMSYPQRRSVQPQAVRCLRWNRSRGWDGVGCRPVELSQESDYHCPYHPDCPLTSQSYDTRKHNCFHFHGVNIMNVGTLLRDGTCHNPLRVHPRPGPSPERTEPDWVNRVRRLALFCTHSPEWDKEDRWNFLLVPIHGRYSINSQQYLFYYSHMK